MDRILRDNPSSRPAFVFDLSIEIGVTGEDGSSPESDIKSANGSTVEECTQLVVQEKRVAAVAVIQVKHKQVSRQRKLSQRIHLYILAHSSSGSILTPRSSPSRDAITELRCPTRWLSSISFQVIGWRSEKTRRDIEKHPRECLILFGPYK
ncbi:hypothetical protein DPX16_3492 [Anabarilius grahami]|uniref:Uncharacterized protein n=1 Tax=Anabarilius grahami TaxID=495550 RepID=A0A3N0Y6X4_ANAGA|nr:hypothetical protein DPX16_3492 [Anabarilius grahami]